MKNELKKRNLPPLPTREEMIEILQREEYGYLPNVEYSISVSEPISVYGEFACGTVEHSYVTLTITVGEKSHSIRVDRLLHTDNKKRPLILFNNFHPMYASRYFALEEMTEKDVNFLCYCYEDITSDNGDFSNGIAPLLLPNGQQKETDCGKIAMWAWANMRVLDYALTLEGTDPNNIGIAGHSRLGKTALYTAMLDERIRFVYSNATGCSGDALYRGNSGFYKKENPRLTGELIEDIYRVFPYWFCKNYEKYTKTNIPDTFDQHFLIGSIAPRYVIIGACSLDFWADPKSQQLCALASSEAWERMGLSGLIGGESELTVGQRLLDGHVAFFLLQSRHLLSRHGWCNFIDFIEKHKFSDK
ncbi:MAG: hypothetical protein IJ400_03975 [Clostridia bacterium]|nr:hypothetical protein [Clostridia bacterium]